LSSEADAYERIFDAFQNCGGKGLPSVTRL
jgi:hypothetical protein